MSETDIQELTEKKKAEKRRNRWQKMGGKKMRSTTMRPEAELVKDQRRHLTKIFLIFPPHIFLPLPSFVGGRKEKRHFTKGNKENEGRGLWPAKSSLVPLRWLL